MSRLSDEKCRLPKNSTGALGDFWGPSRDNPIFGITWLFHLVLDQSGEVYGPLSTVSSIDYGRTSSLYCTHSILQTSIESSIQIYLLPLFTTSTSISKPILSPPTMNTHPNTPPPYGVYTPLVTFFNPDESLDLPTTTQHALRMASSGVSGLVIQGSNGEAVHLLHDERQILFARSEKH